MLRFYIFALALAVTLAMALPSPGLPHGVDKRQTSREEILKRKDLRATRTHYPRADPSSVPCGSWASGDVFTILLSDGTYLTGGRSTIVLRRGGTSTAATQFTFDRSCNLITAADSSPVVTYNDSYPGNYVQFAYDPNAEGQSPLRCSVGTDFQLSCFRVVPQPGSSFGIYYEILTIGQTGAGNISPISLFVQPLPV